MNRAAAGLALAAAVLAGAARGQAPERIDPDRSEARISVDMRLAGQVRGRFGAVEGDLAPTPDGRWRVRVRLDAGALVLEGPEWRQRSVRSANFLDVERHPEIRFEADPFPRERLATGGRLGGQLRLRGITRSVTFTLAPAACPDPGHGCDLVVSGQVNRRDFGMAAYRLWVHDAVTFDIRVRLRHAGAP